MFFTSGPLIIAVRGYACIRLCAGELCAVHRVFDAGLYQNEDSNDIQGAHGRNKPWHSVANTLENNVNGDSDFATTKFRQTGIQITQELRYRLNLLGGDLSDATSLGKTLFGTRLCIAINGL